jgi:hypothetical protein
VTRVSNRFLAVLGMMGENIESFDRPFDHAQRRLRSGLKAQDRHRTRNVERRSERKKGRRKGFILNLSSPCLPVAISLPANLPRIAQAPNRNRAIIQKTTQDVNRITPILMFFFTITAPKASSTEDSQRRVAGLELKHTTS